MRRLFIIATILGWMLTAAVTLDWNSAIAGDEVDYSAPYITLENGELVTKYPPKEHVPGEEPAKPAAGIVEEPPASAPGLPRLPLIAVAAIVIGAALLLLRRGGRQRRAAGQDSAE